MNTIRNIANALNPLNIGRSLGARFLNLNSTDSKVFELGPKIISNLHNPSPCSSVSNGGEKSDSDVESQPSTERGRLGSSNESLDTQKGVASQNTHMNISETSKGNDQQKIYDPQTGGVFYEDQGPHIGQDKNTDKSGYTSDID